MKNPFNFESGAELQQQYHLVVHIIDDNLKYGKALKPKTGTAVIDIYVMRAVTSPPPTSSEVKSYRIRLESLCCKYFTAESDIVQKY